MASSDKLRIDVLGRQTHGAAPWMVVAPIVTAAQVVLGLQTVVSRTQDITQEPAVVTIRTFNEEMRDDLHGRITRLSESVARGSRATC